VRATRIPRLAAEMRKALEMFFIGFLLSEGFS
jgi:hypothetical protein